MLQIGLNKVKFGVFKEMYKISKKTEYSLIILKHIDSKCVTELTTAREIEQNYKAPFDTCAKVMQQMGTKGIVKSIQGVKGGYQLAKPTSEITFFELVEAVEGKKHLTKCMNGHCETRDVCNITGVVNKLNDYIHHFFHGLTLNELFAKNPIELNLNAGKAND